MKYIFSYKLFETKLNRSEVIKLLNDENYVVAIPLTKKSAIKLGNSTSWCTSAVSSNLCKHEFDIYKDDGDILIYVINKKAEKINKEERNLKREKYYKDFPYVEYLDIITDEDFDKDIHDYINLSNIAIQLNKNKNIIGIFDTYNINLMKHNIFLDEILPEYVFNVITDYLYE